MNSNSYQIEKIDLEDFMTNDNNPTLSRLVDLMMQDEEFLTMLERYGRNNSNKDENDE